MGVLGAFVASSFPSRVDGFGAAPAHVDCSTCGIPATPIRPAQAAIAWQDVTPEQFGQLPPAAYGASLAYDSRDAEAVWTGGCAPGGCPSAETWTYSSARWHNLTAQLAGPVPTEYGGMIAYDPRAQAVVLTGGLVTVAAGVVPTNTTWEFSSGAWSHLAGGCDSPVSPVRACRDPMAWASFAFDPDPAVNRTVLFGGCGSVDCLGPGGMTVFANWTYWFNGSTGDWSYRTPLSGPNPSARGGAAMAYDPSAGGLVLFGGEGACGLTPCTLNDTWLYRNGTWSNVTSTFAPVTGRVPARAFGSVTWDAALGELVLVGGQDLPSGAFVNATAVLDCASLGHCHWAVLPIASTPLVAEGAMAGDSTSLNPILVGGTVLSGTTPTNATRTYSALPDLNVAVEPAPQEVGQPVYLNASAVGSIQPSFDFHWGDRVAELSTSGHGVHVFAGAGVYNASVAVVDPNGSANLHTLQLFVHPGPNAQIVVFLPSVDVGVADEFTAVPVLGTGALPYNVSWNFGTGPIVYGTSASHAFVSPGNVTVLASYVDALRLRGTTQTVVHVAAQPVVTIVPEFVDGGQAVADAGVPTTLTAAVTGGTAPFNFTWQFGDGTSGYGLGPSHTYATGSTAPRASVTVADGGGGGANATLAVRVAAALQVTDLSVSPGSPIVGGSATFTAAPTGGDGNATDVWTFGDGARAAGVSASHTYRSVGTFTATFWTNDSAGSSASREVTVTVASSGSVLLGFLLNPLGIAGLLLVLAAIGAGVFRWRRSRRRRAEGPLEPAH